VHLRRDQGSGVNRESGDTMAIAEKLTPRQILSVRCPICLASPREQCKLSTGKPCLKTHLDRRLFAEKMSCSESSGQAAFRVAWEATRRTFDFIFHHR
jgi:hypothetical protein